ncbi:MAG: long-chain fatty acid--CoA ligase [Candidatus Kapaibacterium sp.]|nr:long-chain fatty acid--CoA ligase [Candidatus Kapabacteria bacterium]MBZ0195379.1 long-chain fatty acid--CoA ligase [Candidatus Kapabacteria bacterium]WKZ78160.1 MAG: long-chain fatty acid--CoA ligase [Candidatus Kapabacteria bacterium]
MLNLQAGSTIAHTAMQATTIPGMFLEVCNRFSASPDKIAYSRKVNGIWQHVSHIQLFNDVCDLANGLLELGIKAGDRVGIVSENRLEWIIADFAITGIGGIDVPVFTTLSEQQLAYVFNNCETRAVFVSNTLIAEKLQRIRASIPSLEVVIVMNADVPISHGMLHFSDVAELGQRIPEKQRVKRFYDHTSNVQPEDILTLIYTSGTTGNPKGVMLTHDNLLSNIKASLSVFNLSATDTFLSYLPMCHSYERMSGYYLAFAVGGTTFIAESIETVAENMKEVQPTIMTSVPRLFERIRIRIEQTVSRESGVKKHLGMWALNTGKRYAAGNHTPASTLTFRVARTLVLSKIRNRIGGNLRFFISGGAALRYEDGIFFKALGIPILEGYGLTETSPVLTVNREGEEKLGTVGTPLPNVEIKIAEDGEILARGPNVMAGYWADEEATRAMIDCEGWLSTGDIGVIDTDGRLRITDRKKHLIVSSGGKNIVPLPIESKLQECKYINQVMLVGDGREYCTALIVPDQDAVLEWAARRNLPTQNWDELVRSEELFSEIKIAIGSLQTGFAKYEQVRRFLLLSEPFTVENELLTPTLKVRRNAVLAKYSSQIELLYQSKK